MLDACAPGMGVMVVVGVVVVGVGVVVVAAFGLSGNTSRVFVVLSRHPLLTVARAH